jgi:hypothetical protein
MQDCSVLVDREETTALSLHAQELEPFDALTGDGILDTGLGACGVVFTTVLTLT